MNNQYSERFTYISIPVNLTVETIRCTIGFFLGIKRGTRYCKKKINDILFHNNASGILVFTVMNYAVLTDLSLSGDSLKNMKSNVQILDI